MRLSRSTNRPATGASARRALSPVDPSLCFVERIPLELWVHVIKAARDARIPKASLDDNDEPKGLTVSHRFITPLAKTTKFFNLIVTPLLYERIVFQNERSPAATLRKRPQLLQSVRELVLSYDAIPWGAEEYPDIDLFLQLRNLHCLVLRQNPVTSSLAQVIRNNVNLQRLAIAETRDEDEDNDDYDNLDASEHLHFDRNSLQDSSALAEHKHLTDVTMYAGDSDSPPRISHGKFTQFLAPSIKKLTINTNLVQFLIPMLESGRLSLEHMIDLTVYIQPLPFTASNAFLRPLFALLPNVEAICIRQEQNPETWDTVYDNLLPKLKGISGIGAYIKPFMQGARPIESLEIEDDYAHDIQDIPARLALRTLYLSGFVWKEGSIKALGARFPTLEFITLCVDDEEMTLLVKKWVEGPNIVEDMASLPNLRKLRLVMDIYSHGSGEAAAPAEYPSRRLDKERSILDAVRTSSCPNLVEARLSQGCQWWYVDGWMYELAYEYHTNAQLGRPFRIV